MSESQAVFIDFENIAIWADQEFVELNLTRLLEYVQSHGPIVIKRAYADWSRFQSYRDRVLDNSIDLIQMFSVSSAKNKNRADIRMVIDTLELAITRPQIERFVIVSGDSDFGPLVTRLREYGRKTLGIGPRKITHPLLARSCDQFVFIETILGLSAASEVDTASDRDAARQLLQKALAAHERLGQLPVLTAKLKPMLTSMDPTFDEANLGYGQFRDWLESNSDVVKLYFKDLQMYAAPADFQAPTDFELEVQAPKQVVPTAPAPLEIRYRQALESKLGLVDLQTRRDVLRHIFRELSQHPCEWTADTILETLRQRYEAQGSVRPRDLLLKVWQLGFRQRAYDYSGQPASFRAPVRLVDGIDTEAAFIRRAESTYVLGLIQAGLPIDRSELAAVLLGDRTQVDYIDSILNDLEQRNQIARIGDEHRLTGKSLIPFRDQIELKHIIREIEEAQLPDDLPRGSASAKELTRMAMVQRSQDFAGAAQKYLQACRLQWDAIDGNEAGASVDELRWYIASYASTKAGAMSQVLHNYSASRPYYLAFFWLVQEDDPLFDRMRGLINPMLNYYWINTARELGVTVAPANSPARTAIQLATHDKPEVSQSWLRATKELAQVNPRLLRRISSQIKLSQPESIQNQQVAEMMETMLNE